MEVLFITHKYPPSIGGMQQQSYALITGAQERLTVRRVVHDQASSRLVFFLTLRSRVRQMLKAHPGISLIHLNDGLMAALALGLRKITDLPILVTMHGLDITMPAAWYQKRIIPRFDRYDGIIAVSRATARACVARGCDPERVFVVRNGVDTGLARIPADPGYRAILERRLGVTLAHRRVLVSIGRPVKRKGVSWFIRNVLPMLPPDVIHVFIGRRACYMKTISPLLACLPRSWTDPIVLTLGLESDQLAIETALKSREASGRAFYLSDVSRSEVIQILKLCDLCVMPNISVAGDMEGFGLVALEASVCGCPVLAADIEGLPDAVVEGQNGFLAPSRDAKAWADRIHALLSDPDALKTAARRGQAYTVANYSWETMVSGYLEVFRKCSS